VQALVDTGAANSLIHTKTANRLGIKYEPCKMTICTATGTDTESVKGIAHTKILMRTTKNKIVTACINFIVTDKLNGMDCIIGADFLMDEKNVTGVSNMNIVWTCLISWEGYTVRKSTRVQRNLRFFSLENPGVRAW
jgi:hypothetical protein